MHDFKRISERMLYVFEEKTGKAQNLKTLAYELGINRFTFATMRCRDRIPYKEVILFCKKHKVDIYWLIFEKNYIMGDICFK